MLVTRRGAPFGRLWRKPAALGLAVSLAVMVALVTSAAASATSLPILSASPGGSDSGAQNGQLLSQSSDTVVPAAAPQAGEGGGHGQDPEATRNKRSGHQQDPGQKSPKPQDPKPQDPEPHDPGHQDPGHHDPGPQDPEPQSPRCASASLSPASVTVAVGTAIHFTAGTTGCPSPKYQYSVQLRGGDWSMQRALSTDPTWSWSTTGRAPGTYSVRVSANQTGNSDASGDVVASSTVTLTATAPPPAQCSSASLSPASTSQPAGSTIQFTATSGGCTSAQYEYWVQLLNGTWSMQRAFSADPSWSWSTGSLAAGVYTVRLWANQAGDSTALGEAVASSTVTLAATPPPAPCASASLSPASTSLPGGSTILFAAGSTGCPSPQYEYWVQLLGGSWSMLRAFSTDPTWSWSTAGLGLAPGVYTVHVWANQTGDSTALAEAIGSSTVTLNGCTSAGISPVSTTQPVGTAINFIASSGGCANPQYEYWVQLLDSTWSMQRALGTDATWSWNTAGLAPGAYTVHVWANQTGDSTALGEAIAASTVTLTGAAPAPCASAILSPATTSQPAGSTIQFTASSTGCPSPQYEYWVQFLDGTWSIQRSFSTDPTWSWNTSGLRPGVYTVHVWANQIGDSTSAFEGNGPSTVTLTGCTSAALTPSSGSAPAGGTITFTATSAGCSAPLYQFWMQDTSGGWQIVQPFSTSNTWQWNTAGWPAGYYNFHVWANQPGADLSTWEGNGAATFSLT